MRITLAEVVLIIIAVTLIIAAVSDDVTL